MKRGLKCIGESRVQEAAQKLSKLNNQTGAKLHLIGRLQKNKARKAVELFDVIQTVDSIRLAERISRISTETRKQQQVYLQVNTARDPLKQGFDPKKLPMAARQISKLPNIIISGIMMIPPHIDIDKKYRKIYTKTRELRDKIFNNGIETCLDLSMGMTRDFEMAIEEGATHIRIGTALFGKRPK